MSSTSQNVKQNNSNTKFIILMTLQDDVLVTVREDRAMAKVMVMVKFKANVAVKVWWPSRRTFGNKCRQDISSQITR